MKGMKTAEEFQQAPPPGRYWSIIALAEATFAKSGASMIKLTPTIADVRVPQFKDLSTEDYIITDGSAKGGGMGKTKLRGLGIDVDSTDQEVADEAICAQLQGKGIFVDYGNEQRMTRVGEDGPYNIPMTVLDQKTGQTIKLMKLTVKGYSQHDVGQAQAAAPVQPVNTAPQGAPYAQPTQQAPQYQQAPQGGFAAAPAFQQPPPQFQQQPVAQQAQPAMQPAFQQPGQPGLPPGMQQAAPPWAGQPQPQPVPNGAAPAPRTRKTKVVDVDANGQPIPG